MKALKRRGLSPKTRAQLFEKLKTGTAFETTSKTSQMMMISDLKKAPIKESMKFMSIYGNKT